jgi:tRNA A-37 threonylcarbamoyl transferase component Bud32
MYPQIIISLTTISSRINLLKKTLTSLINQTYKADIIQIYYSNEGYLLDDGINDIIINELYNEIKLIDFYQNNIIFTKVPNIGSYRKLVNAVQTYKNAIIITVDDDIYYSNKLVQIYVSLFNQHNCIISSQYKTIDFDNISSNNKYYLDKNTKTYLNILPEGFGGILYHSNMFDTDFINFNFNYLDELTNKNDDIFFRLYTFYKDIPVVVTDLTNNDIINKNDISLYYKYNINNSIYDIITKIKKYDIFNNLIKQKNKKITIEICSIVDKYVEKRNGTDIKLLQYDVFSQNICENPINLIDIIKTYLFNNQEINTNILVINILKDEYRLKSFNDEIKKLNIKKYVHLIATYWRETDNFINDMNYVYDFLKQFNNICINKLQMNEISFWNDNTIQIQDGPLACYCSHVRAFIYAYLNFKNYFIICEDDIFISNTSNIETYLKQIPENWDIITLNSNPINHKYNNIFYKYNSTFHSTHFYIINVKCLPIIFQNIYPISEQIDILISRLYDRLNIYNICDTVYQKNFSTNTQNNIHTILLSNGYKNIRIAITEFKNKLSNLISNKYNKTNIITINNITDNIINDVVYNYIINNSSTSNNHFYHNIHLDNTNNNLFDNEKTELFNLLYFIIICCVKGINTSIITTNLLNDIYNIIDNFMINYNIYSYGSTSNISLIDNVIMKKYNEKFRWIRFNHNDTNIIFNKEIYILSLFNNIHLPKLIKTDNNIIYMNYLGESLYDNFILPDDWKNQIINIFNILTSYNIIYQEFNLKNILNLNNVLSFIDFGLAEISEFASKKNNINCDVFIEILNTLISNLCNQPKDKHKILYMTQLTYYKNNYMYVDNIFI